MPSRRLPLSPYLNQRLRFEGVYTHRNKPSKHTKFRHGFLFTSIYAKNEDIQLDHVVIEVLQKEYFDKLETLELNKRYSFSAEIKSYYKPVMVLGILVQREHFMLSNINYNTLKEQPQSNMVQPTYYVSSRVQQIIANNFIDHGYNNNMKKLISDIHALNNDGDVEKLINKLVRKTEKKNPNRLQRKDIANKLRSHPKDNVRTLSEK